MHKDRPDAPRTGTAAEQQRTGRDAALAYRPQLNALRGVAVLLVLVEHLYPQLRSESLWPAVGGWEGVRLFYVLSGFLITGILLACRDYYHERLAGRGQLLRQFYARRALRILPPFYLALAAAALLSLGGMRHDWPWHAGYLSNWLFAERDAWGSHVGHLWSLAVEEQYYLVWPVLLLLVPERGLPWLFAAFIACGPLSRGLLQAAGAHAIAVQVVTTSNLDTLGMGGLLAYLNTRSPAAAARFRFAGLALGGPVYLAHRLGVVPHAALLDLAFAGVCVALVHQAAVGVRGPGRWLFDLPPLQYLGKISYAVYLYHNFAPPVLALAARRAHLGLPAEPGPRFLVLAGATVLAASASWYGFEQPVNRFKRYFPYVRRTRPDAASPAS